MLVQPINCMRRITVIVVFSLTIEGALFNCSLVKERAIRGAQQTIVKVKKNHKIMNNNKLL